MTPFWVTAFLDFQADHAEIGTAFWRAATGYRLSPPRGGASEFATLLPPEGDSHLRVQRLADGHDRIHLDLHVDDPSVAADLAVAAGATLVADHGHVVLRSPAGLTLCFVSHPATRRPTPTTWPQGHTSMLDQVCLDIPRDQFAGECAFWEQVTGWAARTSAVSEDFSPLARPRTHPLRLLRQRTGEASGVAGAHLDWATSDRDAETERHVALGAQVLARHPWWSVLLDPTGRAYCITDRDPLTGLLPTG